MKNETLHETITDITFSLASIALIAASISIISLISGVVSVPAIAICGSTTIASCVSAYTSKYN